MSPVGYDPYENGELYKANMALHVRIAALEKCIKARDEYLNAQAYPGGCQCYKCKLLRAAIRLADEEAGGA